MNQITAEERKRIKEIVGDRLSVLELCEEYEIAQGVVMFLRVDREMEPKFKGAPRLMSTHRIVLRGSTYHAGDEIIVKTAESEIVRSPRPGAEGVSVVRADDILAVKRYKEGD